VTGGGFDAIVLAAGSASRFGGGKLLAPWRGGVLLDGALTAAFAAPVRTVVVVTGARGAEVAAAATAFAVREGAPHRLNLVHAEDHAEGMGASLRRGAAALPSDCAGVFVFLGDMPRIPAAVLEPLAATVRAGAPAAAPVFQGLRGHPALIGAGLLPGLATLKGDAGARAVLKDLGDRLALVKAPDDGVLFDVDERGDLDEFRER
jgi:molybdenum cofactor cytidylyltransferase